MFLKSHGSIAQRDGELGGLNFLRRFSQFRIPEVLGVFDSSIALEYFPSTVSPWNEQRFGIRLAEMHAHPGEEFGMEFLTHCGPTELDNQWNPSWTTFFYHQRLLPLISLLEKKTNRYLPYVRDSLERAHLTFQRRWEGICASPAPLHGDLWDGNRLPLGEETALIDPACYWGHSEVDTAMLCLFGTPSHEFWKGYRSVLQEIEGEVERRNYYNLFHYLNHWLLFGGHYEDLFFRKLKNYLKLDT